MNVKINNTSGYPLEYQTKGSVGADLINSDKNFTLYPMDRVLVGTGIFIEEMDENLEAQIRPRSGLAAKQGVTVLNTPGTIDSDYRNEIKVILINLSNDIVLIEKGERIAQIVFNEIVKPNNINIKNIDRIGGFGSTSK
ncbi:MAG: dUTP diphosphatase [bacterium]